MAKGRCFRCRQQGHLSKDCPKRDARANQANAREKPNKRIAEIVDDRDDVSEIGSDITAVSARSTKVNAARMMLDAVMKALESLTKEERDDVLDQVLLKGEDF
jgi:hypothetical protein